MSQLIFKAADVRRVVEHSINAPEQAPQTTGYDDTTGNMITEAVMDPAILLVHDDGVYLMSNGKPRDVVQSGRSYTAHAKGCDPGKDKDTWWDTSRDLVGGDDFSETLPWAREIKRAIDGGVRTVVIHMSGNKMWMTFRK